jgi:hypothetical protein
MSADIRRNVRSVRRRQLLLVTAGVVSALVWPLASATEDFAPVILVSALGTQLLVPLAYVLFAGAVEDTLPLIRGPSRAAPLRARILAFGTIAPCVGSVLEVVLLFRLAQETGRLDGARNRSGLVLALSAARFLAVWILAPALGGLFAVGTGSLMMLVYGVGPLVSFALLSFITQIIITPLLDQLVPEHAEVRLGAAGATSPMAVSSSPDERRP